MQAAFQYFVKKYYEVLNEYNRDYNDNKVIIF